MHSPTVTTLAHDLEFTSREAFTDHELMQAVSRVPAQRDSLNLNVFGVKENEIRLMPWDVVDGDVRIAVSVTFALHESLDFGHLV
jgi:hypothetical protein